MSHAERCPVCGGQGKVQKLTNLWPTTAGFEETCHGCGGLGWVTVQDSRPRGFHDAGEFYPSAPPYDEEPK
jgi:DnaJ-class molecular chaperone